MAFRDNLRMYRERAGLTSKELADRLGISYNTYLNYENLSSEPRYEVLCRIARILSTSPNELLGYNPDHPDKLKETVSLLKKDGGVSFENHPDKLKEAITFLKEGGVKFGMESPLIALYVDSSFLPSFFPKEIKRVLKNTPVAFPPEKILEIYDRIEYALKKKEKDLLPQIIKEVLRDIIAEDFMDSLYESGALKNEIPEELKRKNHTPKKE